MNTTQVNVRPLHPDDLNAVVGIDEKVFELSHPEYYQIRFNRALDQKDRLVLSLVAEEDGKLVGFLMCELFVGEYGIPANTATLDTTGIHPDYQRELVNNSWMNLSGTCENRGLRNSQHLWIGTTGS